MRRLPKTIAMLSAMLVLSAPVVSAAGEVANVKYRGSVPLDTFTCVHTPDSSVIGRICYDEEERYMIVRVRQNYYHYCDVDAETVAAFVGAPSAGKFYNSYIKGAGSVGPFDCRTRRIPAYP
jgi:hypothetical protein